MTTLQGFTKEFLSELFDYDPLTGLVTRKVARTNSVSVGQVVGSVDGKGYLHVSVNKKFIRLHRLAFFLMTGVVPPDIDHKDNDKKNNAWSNLRPANRSQQSGNTRPPRHNTSGVKGVSRNSASGKWHAQIKIRGKQTYLGRFDTIEEAAEVYELAAELHFGEFARGISSDESRRPQK